MVKLTCCIKDKAISADIILNEARYNMMILSSIIMTSHSCNMSNTFGAFVIKSLILFDSHTARINEIQHTFPNSKHGKDSHVT